jgi:carboxyl-terminal processing protease
MTKRATRSCVTFFLLLFCAGTIYPQPADAGKIGLNERAWIASKLYSSVQYYFAHWQVIPDFDLDAAYKKYLEQILTTDDRAMFDLASMEFLAQLRNGHTRFQDRWLKETHGYPLGFFLARLEGKWVVTQSRVDGLAPGDVVQSIDEIATDEFFAQKRKYIGASSEAAQQRALFFMPYLFPETFLLRIGNGKMLTINRKEQKLQLASPRVLEGRILDAGIAYLRIPSFSNPQDEEKAVEFVKQHSQAKRLIIDVCGNGGGSTPGRLIRALMDRSYRDWTLLSAQPIGMMEAAGYFNRSGLLVQGNLVKPQEPLYTGEVVIITDGDCASACEDFVMPPKVSGRARVVGQATYGSSGTPYVFDFGNGMSFFVGSKRMFFPDGSPFEGVGITPDVKIEPSVEDIRSGRDVVLDVARSMQVK